MIEAHKEELMLWDRLAEIPDRHISDITIFKNEILKELRIESKNLGSPLCEEYLLNNRYVCYGCPIKYCTSHPSFKIWHETALKMKLHDQYLAKVFAEHLHEVLDDDAYIGTLDEAEDE